jgi:hypothetical protein
MKACLLLRSWGDPDNIKASLTEKEYEDVDWILVAQDRE